MLRSTWLATPLVGLAGGYLASLVNWPLPWLVGGLLAVLLTRCAGWLIEEIPYGRSFGQALVAAGMGLHLSPEVVHLLASHAPVLLLCSLATLLLSSTGWFIFRRFGADAPTAFFASMPGGASEMISLAQHHGSAAPEKVAAAQSLRILLVVLCIPPLFTFTADSLPVMPQSLPVDWVWFLSLLAAGLLLTAVFSRWHLPLPWMLGPLLAFGVATFSQDLQLGMPAGWSDFGQWLIGCSIGSHFDRAFFRKAPPFLLRVVLFTTFTLLGGMGVAWLVTRWVDLPLVAVILGMMPGGISELSLTAEALNQPVGIVLAMQLSRFLMVVLLADLLFRVVRRYSRPAPTKIE